MIIGYIQSWQSWAILAIVVTIGLAFIFAQKKSKILNKFPKPMMMIIFGAILVGGGMYNTGFLSAKNWGLISYLGLVSSSLLLFFAGYDIETQELKKFGLPAILMGILPSLVEGFLVGTMLLPMMGWFNPGGFVMGEHWAFAYAMGFALAAATPGIIIPMLNKFQKQGYSKHNKLNEIIIIGSSLDDITALSMFLIFLSISSPSAGVSTYFIISQIPVKLIFSVVIGIFIGLIFSQLSKPIRQKVAIKENKIILVSSLLLISLGLVELSSYISSIAEESSTNTKTIGWLQFEYLLSAMAMGLTCSYFMKEAAKTKQQKEASLSIIEPIGNYWTYFGSLVLFASAGTNVEFNVFADGKVYVFIPVILVGLLVGRFIGISASLFDKKQFKWNDKVFATAAYIPKGTATAAGILLFQTKITDPELIEFATTMLLPAALIAIIITIPIAELIVSAVNSKLQFKTKENDESPIISIKEAFKRK